MPYPPGYRSHISFQQWCESFSSHQEGLARSLVFENPFLPPGVLLVDKEKKLLLPHQKLREGQLVNVEGITMKVSFVGRETVTLSVPGIPLVEGEPEEKKDR